MWRLSLLKNINFQNKNLNNTPLTQIPKSAHALQNAIYMRASILYTLNLKNSIQRSPFTNTNNHFEMVQR